MPTPNEILADLTAIANDWRLVAVGWHILVGCSLVALALRWRPTKHLAASLLVLPLLSVNLFAWITSNPFNGFIFLVFAVLLIATLIRPQEVTVVLEDEFGVPSAFSA